jgi:hypothetical protein
MAEERIRLRMAVNESNESRTLSGKFGNRLPNNPASWTRRTQYLAKTLRKKNWKLATLWFFRKVKQFCYRPAVARRIPGN